MIKTLWYSLYILLAIALLACAATILGSIIATFAFSPWCAFAIPVTIFLTVLTARAAGWAADNGIDA